MPYTTAPSAAHEAPDLRTRVLASAADAAGLAPSVHNTQPWRFVLHADRLELHADRSRQLTVMDPLGRELVQSVGAALCNARVALAAAGWGADVARLPRPDDPDLLAAVYPVEGASDADLARLGPYLGLRRTNRRRFAPTPVPDEVVRALAHAVAAEGAHLVPVLADQHRRLVARLTQAADAAQNADAAYRAELRRWTNRDPERADGVPTSAVPAVDGSGHDDVPLRDFDTRGAGQLPPDTHSDADQTLVVLTTDADDPLAWLRAGEALERLLLELTAQDLAVSPITQAVEDARTRAQLRSALTWEAHPQSILRIGRAQGTPPTPRRPRDEVVRGSTAPPEPATPPHQRGELGWCEATERRAQEDQTPDGRPVADGRGGTTWLP